MDLVAYTDGACSGNPGPGGWGVLLIARKNDEILKESELCGGEPETTNNRMELQAAIEALNALSRSSTITIITDSSYVKDGITKWLAGWKKNGWKTAQKKPVKNEELWKALDEARSNHSVTWDCNSAIDAKTSPPSLFWMISLLGPTSLARTGFPSRNASTIETGKTSWTL